MTMLMRFQKIELLTTEQSDLKIKYLERHYRTVPNDLRFWLFMHFKKVSLERDCFQPIKWQEI